MILLYIFNPKNDSQYIYTGIKSPNLYKFAPAYL